MGERVRTTISVAPEVLEVFKQMAAAGGVSTSRAMGDWLADTVDGAQFVSAKVQEARKAPSRLLGGMTVGSSGLGLDKLSVANKTR
jgi:hypothetical protein